MPLVAAAAASDRPPAALPRPALNPSITVAVPVNTANAGQPARPAAGIEPAASPANASAATRCHDWRDSGASQQVRLTTVSTTDGTMATASRWLVPGGDGGPDQI